MKPEKQAMLIVIVCFVVSLIGVGAMFFVVFEGIVIINLRLEKYCQDTRSKDTQFCVFREYVK
jgi:hypothetical protein